MKGRVTGVGGVFYKARDPERLKRWYREHLGIDVADWGGFAFSWRDKDEPRRVGSTVWSLFPADTDYFGPGPQPFMVNFRVRDLDAVLAALRAEGCQVHDAGEASDFGRFGWVVDAEGNKLELWEPPASELEAPAPSRRPAKEKRASVAKLQKKKKKRATPKRAPRGKAPKGRGR